MPRSIHYALVLVLPLGGCPPTSLDPIVTDPSSGGGTGGTSGTSTGVPTSGTDPGAATTGPEVATTGPGTSGTGTSTGSTSEPSTGSANTLPADTTGDPPGTSTGFILDTTGGSTGGSTSTGADDTTGDPVMPSECLRSVPLLQAPDFVVEDGLELCANGQIHRPAAVECVHPFEVDLCADPMKCKTECDAFGAGVCNTSFENTCACRYPCETDADCADNAACLCGAIADNHWVVPNSQCYRADCRTDADCAGFQCGLSPGVCGPGTLGGMFCRGPADECQTHQECFDKKLGNMCWFDTLKDHWACTESALCE